MKIQSRFLVSVLAILTSMLVAGPVLAGSQDNAVIALHAKHLTPGEYTPSCADGPTVPCSEYVSEWSAWMPGWVYLMVARGDPTAGVGGLSCGITYDWNNLILQWVFCGDLEFPSQSWPNPQSGNRMVWDFVDNCQRTVYGEEGVHAVAGAFYVYAYAPTQLEIIEHPELMGGPEFLVVDCSNQTSDVPYPGHAGMIGFGGLPGRLPCCTSCVDVWSGTVDACLGDTVQVPVIVTNCDAGAEDIVLECTVDGVPRSPAPYLGVAAGDSVTTWVEVVPDAPGMIVVECTATATLVADSTCTGQATAQGYVLSGDACATVDLSGPGQACAGDSVLVEVLLTNCSADAGDLSAQCTVAGIVQSPVAFGNVPGFDTRMFQVTAWCPEGGGLVTVTCDATVISRTNPSCTTTAADTFQVECLDPNPAIAGIGDVPNDQGRRVRIQWAGSCYDRLGVQFTVTEYGIWRRIDPLPALAVSPPGREGTGRLVYPPGSWDYVTTVPARGEAEYSTVVETLCDSTVAAGLCRSVFFISARTPDPRTYFDSAPDSGYSVDNLAPAAPGGLQYQAPGSLVWEEAPEADFDHYSVYGSHEDALDDTAELLGTPVEPGLSVLGDTFSYYHVTVSDYNGNESQASSVVNTGAVPEPGFVPGTYRLYQSRPNPFSAMTRFTFDLPEAGPVRVRIFDIQGRPVRALVDGELEAGRYSIPWMGRDDSGRRMGPGIYFYSYETRSFRETKKAILIR